MQSNRAKFDTLRTALPAAIGASYTAIGGPLPTPATVVHFQNNTNGDVVVSQDGTTDILTLPANSFQIWDVRTNSPALNEYLIAAGTQFYVKDGTTPSSTGAFNIMALILRQSNAV